MLLRQRNILLFSEFSFRNRWSSLVAFTWSGNYSTICLVMLSILSGLLVFVVSLQLFLQREVGRTIILFLLSLRGGWTLLTRSIHVWVSWPFPLWAFLPSLGSYFEALRFHLTSAIATFLRVREASMFVTCLGSCRYGRIGRTLFCLHLSRVLSDCLHHSSSDHTEGEMLSSDPTRYHFVLRDWSWGQHCTSRSPSWLG